MLGSGRVLGRLTAGVACCDAPEIESHSRGRGFDSPRLHSRFCTLSVLPAPARTPRRGSLSAFSPCSAGECYDRGRLAAVGITLRRRGTQVVQVNDVVALQHRWRAVPAERHHGVLDPGVDGMPHRCGEDRARSVLRARPPRTPPARISGNRRSGGPGRGRCMGSRAVARRPAAR